MQGLIGSQHAVPLGERFTLLLATHNRPAFLRRTLKYYSTFPCTIIVLDSSTESNAHLAVDYPHVQYQHLPQFSYLGFQAKLKHGVAQVTTPYMAFAADDDFLLHGALNESVEFLEANPDYGMCHGYCLMYLTDAQKVLYYRRDKKVMEDYSSPLAEQRVLDVLGNFIPPFFAVTRTELLREWYEQMPEGLDFEWQEIGHAYYVAACAKVRILPIPYVVREANYGGSEHNTEVLYVLTFTDAKSVAAREKFADFLSTVPTAIEGRDQAQTKAFALQSFEAMAQCLLTGRSLTTEQIFHSTWDNPFKEPARHFRPTQYVELPFYNKPFFDLLTEFEFLLHGLPAGRHQLKQLEPLLLRQEKLMQVHPTDSEQTRTDRLWHALDCNVFNRRLVKELAQKLEASGDERHVALNAWSKRLESLSSDDSRMLLDTMPSGRLLSWLKAREPDALVRAALPKNGAQICILLLDLQNDMNKLQATFDTLLNGPCKTFKVVVLTTGDLPAQTTPQNTVHFVSVTAGNYIDSLNQVVRHSTSDWLLLAEAGDEFTASGLLRASLELRDAPGCRAVAMDEIQRQANGTLADVLRPGFNLDLLQSFPAMLARHWLISREAIVAAGGYSRDFSKALDFDLLLRLIEQGGLAGLAHLDEPLLIGEAPVLEENDQERKTLIRHLATRGYQAQVGSPQPGTYQIDYRHSERPQVTIILQSLDNLVALQACLESLLLRTRYQRYEVLVADNGSQSEAHLDYLNSLAERSAKVRVLRIAEGLSSSALVNAAAAEAKGEYLVLLAADGEVVNANWIESLLNQAQRPEVGVVGGKLVDRMGNTTQAGLVLGLNGVLGSPFVGAKKEADGYLNRLLLEQNYSAVSAVCLMVRKALFDAIGGLDEGAFSDAYADIDLCLTLADAGYLTVWTPQVQIMHVGDLPQAPQAAAALTEKWQARFEQDTAYNNSLQLTGKGYVLDESSRVNWAQFVD